MNWIRDFVLALLLTSITGSLLMAVWMTVIHTGRKKWNVHYVWWMLRGVLAGYLLPLAYLPIHQYMEIIRKWYGVLSVSNSQIDKGIQVLFGIWVAGVIFFLLSQLHMWICFRQIKRSCMTVPKEYLEILQKLCEEINSRRPVSLYQGYGVESPFVVGVRKPAIYLPVREFSVEELEMILYHELIHYKQGDTFWKPLFGLLGNIYWFSPLSRLLSKEMVRWTEANCDSYCCEERFQAKKYFMLLLKMGSTSRSPFDSYMPMWTEGGRELEWRIKCIKRNKIKKSKGMVIAVIVILSILSGGVSTHAAFRGIERVYFGIYWNTVEGIQELRYPVRQLENEGTAEEYTEMKIVEHSSEVQKSERTILDKIKWTVGDNTIHYTEGFTAYAGGKITVQAGIASDTISVDVGILKPDGKTSYVNEQKFISHTFNISETGIYKVFVSNSSWKKVEVEGGYIYSHR